MSISLYPHFFLRVKITVHKYYYLLKEVKYRRYYANSLPPGTFFPDKKGGGINVISLYLVFSSKTGF